MVRKKTSAYIDEELWTKFKLYASKRAEDVSRVLEEAIKDEMVEEELESAIMELVNVESYELDFEPVEPKEGTVSQLIRVMRDERADSLS